jgi:hypothetical protein
MGDDPLPPTLALILDLTGVADRAPTPRAIGQRPYRAIHDAPPVPRIGFLQVRLRERATSASRSQPPTGAFTRSPTGYVAKATIDISSRPIWPRSDVVKKISGKASHRACSATASPSKEDSPS